MKKIYLLLAATFISAPLAMNSQAFAADVHADAAHKTAMTAHHAAVNHPAANVNKASGTVYMTFHSADVGVGYSWGDGVLHFRGKEYKFTIKGGDIVALGFSKSQASGHVYNLKNIYDFAGDYAVASGEATAGVGFGGAQMRNNKNVTVTIDTKTIGGRLAGAPGGISIKFVSNDLQKLADLHKGVKPSKGKVKSGTTEDLNKQQLDKIKK